MPEICVTQNFSNVFVILNVLNWLKYFVLRNIGKNSYFTSLPKIAKLIPSPKG